MKLQEPENAKSPKFLQHETKELDKGDEDLESFQEDV